jgi:oxygen-dependent protoporphyrinogen oxidase
MTVSDVEYAVIGAGVAGLAAAITLRRAGREVAVLEARERPGGAAWSERIDGHLVERGPNTFRVSPAMAAFLRDHHFDGLLVPAEPESRARFLLRGGALVPVPTSPWAFARTPLLGVGGKLRLLGEPFVRRGDATGESVAEFATRRFGAATCRALVGPFLTGIYAGDEQQLGAEAVFPALVEAERRSGSVAIGLAARALRGRQRGRPGTWSGAEGVGGLTDALAGAVGPSLRLLARVSSVRFEEGMYRIEVEVDSGVQVLRSTGLVVAAAAPAVAGLDPDVAKALAAIESAPLASVALSLPRGATRVPIRGFGYLVPRGEGEALLGCLFSSRLFARRAPPERELLTLLAGGVRNPALLDRADDRLVAVLAAELDRALGLRETPRVLAITRWPRAVPQPGRDHPRLVADARARLAAFPRLALAGASFDGVAFGDALASGARAASRLLGGAQRAEGERRS